MAKPIIEFKEEPPVLLTCKEEREIQLTVRPNCPGDCQVVLSMIFTSCSFQDGQQQVTEIVTAQAMDDRLECTFKVKMTCDEPDTYFTLLFAHAINAEGEKSYRKPIEAEIECQASIVNNNPTQV
jgi:hypothetical protein